MGIPYMLICGKRSEEGFVELKNRRTLEKEELSLKDAMDIIIKAVKSI